MSDNRPPAIATLDRAHIDQVFKLLCRGLDRDLIIAYAAEFQWKERPAELDALIVAAHQRMIEAAADIDTDAELGKAIARLNHLYMEASKVQDHKTALAIQKEINKILALKVEREAGARANNQPAGKTKLRIVKK